MTSSAGDLVGLVPAAIDPGRRLVHLIGAGSAWFNEPFYRMTLDRLERAGRPRRLRLSFDELREALGDERPEPAGLVLHTSRCGSTLLTRMLRHDRTSLVLSEPSPIGAAIRLRLDEPEDPQATALVTDLVALLERFASGRNQRSVLKLSSWQAIATDDLAGRFPLTAFVFVHRPAHEVVASLLAHPPSWAPAAHGGPATPPPATRATQPAGGDLLDRGGLPGAILDGIDPSLDSVRYFASVWAALVRAALAGPDERMLFVNFTELLQDPASVLTLVAAHLSLGATFDPARAAGELGYYAKATNPTEPFEPAGRHHRQPLTRGQRDQVDLIAGDLPTCLAERTISHPPRRATAGATRAGTRPDHG